MFGSLSASIRRSDLQGATGEGPDGYGAINTSGWGGSFGRRCVTSGGSSGSLSVPPEPLHLYAYGVSGIDVAKVELVWDGGQRVEATLGDPVSVLPVRWWIAAYDTGDPDQIMATDYSGGTWTIPILTGVYGQVNC